jgi:hypothetical protein
LRWASDTGDDQIADLEDAAAIFDQLEMSALLRVGWSPGAKFLSRATAQNGPHTIALRAQCRGPLQGANHLGSG